MDNLDNATEHFERAVEFHESLGDDFMAKEYTNIGLILEQRSKYEEALKLYDDALNVYPDFAEAWYNKGLAYEKLGNWDKAKKCYDEVIKLIPANREAIKKSIYISMNTEMVLIS